MAKTTHFYYVAVSVDQESEDSLAVLGSQKATIKVSSGAAILSEA